MHEISINKFNIFIYTYIMITYNMINSYESATKKYSKYKNDQISEYKYAVTGMEVQVITAGLHTKYIF